MYERAWPTLHLVIGDQDLNRGMKERGRAREVISEPAYCHMAAA